MLEKSPRLGGLIRTDITQGCLLEAGPDGYLASKPAVTELAAQLNLENEIVSSNDAQRRVFVVRNSEFIEIPQGMSMMVPGDLNAAMKTPLFSSNTKLRLLAEIFYPQRHRLTDISVQELVLWHFGEELLEYVTEPLLSGVYGGNSAQLSAESVLPRFIGYEREYGSLIRGVRRERRAPAQTGSLFLSFQRGMQSLTDALSNAIAGSVVVLHEEVQKVEPVSGEWRINSANGQHSASHVVLALPAYAVAELLGHSIPALASELSGIPYSSAMLVTLVYRKAEPRIPDGFGFLVPCRERQTISACTLVGTKWPSRIPADLLALRAFIVDPEAPKLLSASNDELVDLVRADFDRLMHVTADPLFSAVQRWPNSMPQYVVGHSARQKRIAGLLSQFPGLHLTGNAYEGVGIPDCVRLAKRTAEAILACND